MCKSRWYSQKLRACKFAICSITLFLAQKRPKLRRTYNEKEAGGPHKWTGFSVYKDTIKLLADFSSSYFWQTPLPKLWGMVGYSQVLQGLQPWERFLGHWLNLVSKQSSAVSKHPVPEKQKENGERGGKKKEGTQLVWLYLIYTLSVSPRKSELHRD